MQISLQGRYNRHASWILNGVVIRIAQKMGLHRDGELLGLKPFETEMRRRLWWQIIMVDAKYAMLSGLSHTLLPRGWDTKEPKNISDEDLGPSATEPIQDREGPTEMILVLIVYRIAKNLISLPGVETILLLNELDSTMGGSGPNREKVQEYRRVIRDLNKDLDELVAKFSAPDAGPLHMMARLLKDHLMGKLTALTNPPAEGPEWGTEVFDHTSNAFKLAVDTTRHSVEQYKMAIYPGWDWFSRLHFQLDVFAYLVGQLCHRTTGQIVDRAWEVVEEVYQYHPEFYETSNRIYYQLAHFTFKAWRKREAAVRSRSGSTPETPKCVQNLRLLMPGSDESSTKSESEQTSNGDPFNSFAGTNANGTVGSMDGLTGVVTGPTFDAYMGNYFDFNGALDFDIWGTSQSAPTNALSQVPPMQPMQLQDMMQFGMGPTQWK